MKRFLIGLMGFVGLMGIVGCVKEPAIEMDGGYTGKGFQLTIEQGGGTKTILGTGGDIRSVYWNDGDIIRVNGAEYNVLTNADRTLSEIHFDNSSPSGAIAFFPSSICGESNPGAATVTVSLPSSYKYSEWNGHQVLNMPLVGKAAPHASGISMKHLCGAVKVDVTNQTGGIFYPDTIFITSTRQLCGNRTIDVINMESLTVAQANAAGGNGKVMITGCPSIAIGATRSIVVPVLPCDNLTVRISGHVTYEGIVGQGPSTVYQRTATGHSLVRAGMMTAPVTVNLSDTYNSSLPSNYTFSVSPTKKVYFSQSNLAYSNNVWTFLPNQWDRCFGFYQYDNDMLRSGDVSPYYNETNNYFDHYCYGAAGYLLAAWGMANVTFDISGTIFDWGGYSPIAGGGNQAGLWRSLTYDEWVYLLTQRPGGYVKNGTLYRFWCTSIKLADNSLVPGIVIFPDNTLGGAGMIAHGICGISGETNYISSSDWNTYMQPNGCAFLPQAGILPFEQHYIEIDLDFNELQYWTGSNYDDQCAYQIKVSLNTGQVSTTYPNNICYHYHRLPVRLVKDAN